MRSLPLAALFGLAPALAAAAPPHAGQPPAGVGYADIAGCGASGVPMYGKYAVKFCLAPTGYGAFHAAAGGYGCKGGLSWYREQGIVRIDIAAKCPGEIDWDKDRVRCRIEGAAPYAALACTYTPGHGHPFGFTAERIAH